MRLGALRVSLLSALLIAVGSCGCSSIRDFALDDTPARVERPAVRPPRASVSPTAGDAEAAAPPAVRPAPVGSPRVAGASPTIEDRRTFDEANRMRAARGLAPFRWSDDLFRAARDHSAEQARHGYMGHGSPDPSRDDLADRLRLADCGALRAWAEVVAFGYEGPFSVVDGWMNSKGHRKILLDPKLEEAGFARVGDYFTGNFATRR